MPPKKGGGGGKAGKKRSRGSEADQSERGAEVRSRVWVAELELSAAADEEAVRTALLGASNVLWVPKLSAK